MVDDDDYDDEPSTTPIGTPPIGTPSDPINISSDSSDTDKRPRLIQSPGALKKKRRIKADPTSAFLNSLPSPPKTGSTPAKPVQHTPQKTTGRIRKSRFVTIDGHTVAVENNYRVVGDRYVYGDEVANSGIGNTTTGAVEAPPKKKAPPRQKTEKQIAESELNRSEKGRMNVHNAHLKTLQSLPPRSPTQTRIDPEFIQNRPRIHP